MNITNIWQENITSELGELEQYNEWIFYYQPTPPSNEFRDMKA